ncbi:hypothetical protein [Paenibacillus glycanilyticus]|uniref:NfeD-like C-terminal domain-containing protein n=1 Tax=Paenibacillus glycanilyticus TaxID=126569 RepID=A0ABQ6GBS0_9BACL|nr:hypothetical protein [Paenibacillus glycanilyticus]GLX66517.1 hypothetical protein MU1_08610 [Paenibacillus glycanilyticus]
MPLKPNKTIYFLIIICLLQLSTSVARLFTTEFQLMPDFIGFTYFLTSLVFLGLLVVLITDLITKARRTIKGRIINKEGNIIHVLRDDGKVKRYKINVPEVLEVLQADYRVEIESTNLSNILSRITVIE